LLKGGGGAKLSEGTKVISGLRGSLVLTERWNT